MRFYTPGVRCAVTVSGAVHSEPCTAALRVEREHVAEGEKTSHARVGAAGPGRFLLAGAPGRFRRYVNMRSVVGAKKGLSVQALSRPSGSFPDFV